MAGPLLDCPVHGIQEDRKILLGAGSHGTITGGQAPCPLCGRRSAYVSGYYDNDPQTGMRATLNPTPSQLKRLQTAVKWAEENRETQDQEKLARDLEKTARENIPGMGAILDSIGSNRSMGIAAWIGIILVFIQMVIGGQSLSEEDADRLVRETIEQQQQIDDSQPSPAAPAPAAPPPTLKAPAEAPSAETELPLR